MSSIERCLARVGSDLDDLGTPWALVGALAVAVHAVARATLDVDVVVATSSLEERSRLVEALIGRGYRLEADFGQSMSSFSVPHEPVPGLRLDLLFSLTGVESEVALAAERLLVLPGLSLPVALRGDLIALKLLAADEPEREHDRRDLRSLLDVAGPSDLERARATIALLVRRGIVDSGKLDAELDRLVAERAARRET